MSDFFFGATRITCAQILKSAGVDRCAPSTLDAFTDIFIRYMGLLAHKCKQSANVAGKDEIEACDLALALEQTRLIRPSSQLDYWEESDWTVQGWAEFVEWVQGPILAEQQRVSGAAVKTKEGAGNHESNANQATNDITKEGLLPEGAVGPSIGLLGPGTSGVDNNVPSQKGGSAALDNAVRDMADGDAGQNEVQGPGREKQDWLTRLVQRKIDAGHEHKVQTSILGEKVVASEVEIIH